MSGPNGIFFKNTTFVDSPNGLVNAIFSQTAVSDTFDDHFSCSDFGGATPLLSIWVVISDVAHHRALALISLLQILSSHLARLKTLSPFFQVSHFGSFHT